MKQRRRRRRAGIRSAEGGRRGTLCDVAEQHRPPVRQRAGAGWGIADAGRVQQLGRTNSRGRGGAGSSKSILRPGPKPAPIEGRGSPSAREPPALSKKACSSPHACTRQARGQASAAARDHPCWRRRGRGPGSIATKPCAKYRFSVAADAPVAGEAAAAALTSANLGALHCAPVSPRRGPAKSTYRGPAGYVESPGSRSQWMKSSSSFNREQGSRLGMALDPAQREVAKGPARPQPHPGPCRDQKRR